MGWQGKGPQAGARRRSWSRRSRRLTWLGMVVCLALPLFMTVERYSYSPHDRLYTGWLKGSADLWMPFNGARALLLGLDPYHNDEKALVDPAGWPQTYPAPMHLLYVPLVLLSGDSHPMAAGIFFVLNLEALLASAIAVVSLMRRYGRWTRAEQVLLGALTVGALSTNASAAFCLDRAQSELVTGSLCWCAVALFAWGRPRQAIALAVVATAMKGYAAPLAIGLLLAAPAGSRRGAWATAVGVSALLIPPVAHVVLSGLDASLDHTGLFWPVWFNHSFKFLGFQYWRENADGVRWGVIAADAVATLFCGVALVKASRWLAPAQLTPHLVLFALAALCSMLGVPQTSAVYNLTLVLPGVVLVVLSNRELSRSLQRTSEQSWRPWRRSARSSSTGSTATTWRASGSRRCRCSVRPG